MVDIVTRYTCDLCGESNFVSKGVDSSLVWTTKTEIGDLCPNCYEAWEDMKKSFITRVKMVNGKDIV